MFDIGTREVVIIAVVIILLFGAKKIPELARGIGEAIRHIRGGFKEEISSSDAAKQEVNKKK